MFRPLFMCDVTVTELNETNDTLKVLHEIYSCCSENEQMYSISVTVLHVSTHQAIAGKHQRGVLLKYLSQDH